MRRRHAAVNSEIFGLLANDMRVRGGRSAFGDKVPPWLTVR